MDAELGVLLVPEPVATRGALTGIELALCASEHGANAGGRRRYLAGGPAGAGAARYGVALPPLHGEARGRRRDRVSTSAAQGCRAEPELLERWDFPVDLPPFATRS